MKRRKRKKRRRWPMGSLRPESRRNAQVERRQIGLPGVGRMPMRRPPRLVDAIFGRKCAKLAGPSETSGGVPSELFSEREEKFSGNSSRPVPRVVVHFAGLRAPNKQFMYSLWLLSCLVAAASSLPYLQQRRPTSEQISARADELPTATTTTTPTSRRADGLNFITTESARAETSASRLHDDKRQSVFVPLAPISERHRRTRAAGNATTTAPRDQDLRAMDPLNMTSLPAGSRLVLAREGQQIELACDAREFDDNTSELSTGNEREFIFVGANKTIQKLNSTDNADDRQQPAARPRATQHDDSDYLDADQLTDRLVSLVFWYRNDDPAPIYTLDARSSAGKLGLIADSSSTHTSNVQRLVDLNKQLLGAAKHYERNRTGADELYDLRSRIKINDWPVIKLELNGLRGHHSGDYKCRVDFRRARTIRRIVRLFVEVPLHNLSLTVSDDNYTSTMNDNSGDIISLVETSNRDAEPIQDQNQAQIVRANQDQRVTFECRANEGARPEPILSWLVSWPSSNAMSTEEREEFFASPESQARLARLLNGSIEVGRDGDGHARRLASKRESSKLVALVNGSKLILNRVGRSMHGLRVGCRARQARLALDETADQRQLRPQPANHAHPVSQGANSAAPVLESTRWLELELSLKPESVGISRLEQQTPSQPSPRNKETGPEVRAGIEPAPREQVQKVSLDEREPITLVCSARGARPPARLSWSWLGGGGEHGEPIGPLATKASETFGGDGGGGGPKIIDKTNGDEGESTSQLEFPHGLARQWHGRKLLCIATNEATKASDAGLGAPPASAHLELDIRYKPSVQLIERTKDKSRAGKQQRRFECRHQANPPINQLVWLVNGRPLVPASQLINKTTNGDGRGSDQAEITQVARAAAKSGAVRRHNKLFRFDSATWVSETTGDDDERAPDAEYARERAQKMASLSGVDSGIDSASEFVTIDELGEEEHEHEHEHVEPMAELKCVVANAMGEQASEPLVWAASERIEELVKCRLDERLAALKKGRPDWDSSAHDSLLGQIEAHKLVLGGWPSQDKFSCELDSAAGLNATRYVWSFVPFEQVPEHASHWAKWPLGLAERELLSHSSELTAAAERLQIADRNSVRGVLLCKVQLAGGQEWWPRSKPCLTLVSANAQDHGDVSKSTVERATSLLAPSAENCRIEPILIPARARSKSIDRLAISVDCSAAPGKEALIFELGVARRQTATSRNVRPSQTGDAISQLQEQLPGQLDDLMLLDERSNAPENKTSRHQQQKQQQQQQQQQRRAKRLLFTEHAVDTTSGGYRRLALTDLITSQDSVPSPGREDEPVKWKESERKLGDPLRANKFEGGAQESESARKLHQAGGDSASEPHAANGMNSGINTSSLNEQVALLNELVFTLRASDLMRVSEPRAIYGSELRLAKHTSASGGVPAPTGARRTKSSQRESDENTSGPAAPLSRSVELLQLLAGDQPTVQDLEGRGWRENATRMARPTHLDLMEWGRQHEVGITMAAIGATILLSALTLTLIVLVLQRNRRKTSSSPVDDASTVSKNRSPTGHQQHQPELVLTRSGSRVSLASRSHQVAPESPASSDCQNLRKTNDSLHLGKADQYRTDHVNGSYRLAGSDLRLDEYAVSLAGSQVDFLAPPAHQLRQQSQRLAGRQLSSASSSSCTTSYTLTNSARRPPRQVRLNLSPLSMGVNLDDTQEHTSDYNRYLNSLPRGQLDRNTQNLLALPADLQVAHAPICGQHQHEQIFEHHHQMATTDCSFEQSPGSLMSLSEHATGSLSGGGGGGLRDHQHHQTCHPPPPPDARARQSLIERIRH